MKIDLLKIKMKNHFSNYFEELITNVFSLKLLYQQEYVNVQAA